MQISRISHLLRLVLLVLICATQLAQLCHGLTVYVPSKFRSEGRITMEYSFNDDIVQHQLVFSEINDSDSKRSKVKVGYISHDPQEYIARKDLPVLIIDSDGSCRASNLESKFDFVPELQWFILQAFQAEQIIKFLQENPHLVGPTGIVKLIADYTKGLKYEYSHEITHRNIPCDVYTKHYSRPGCENVVVELYVPKTQKADPKGRQTYFTLKETAHNMFDSHGNKISVSYTIDYFHFDNLENDLVKAEKLEDDFSLAMGRGCSFFLPLIRPKLQAQSLVMSYVRRSSLEPHMIAYDQAAGHLRRELPGDRVTIWDINEGLMYNTDPASVFGNLKGKAERDSLCSVMSVADKNLHSNYRPFQVVGQPLSILELLGADSVAYIGRDVVRDIPCIVFEAAFKAPPTIFGLTSSEVLLRPKNTSETRYIVQYYIMHPDRNDPNKIQQQFSQMSDKEFWPARLSLYEYNSPGIKLIETLDIYDFYLSLHGWPVKASQMFMAPACFSNEKELATVEMTMIFDKSREPLVSSEYFRILTHNKYKLEFDLLSSLFSDVFRMSLLHLVDFDLNLRPHHVSLDLIVGDRRDKKILTYFGEGKAPTRGTDGKNSIVLIQQTEDSCVSAGSLIEDVSLVVWCPPVDGSKQTQCFITYGSDEPTIEKYTSESSAPCQAYRFSTDSQFEPVTHDWNDRKRELIDWSFEFKAMDYYREIPLIGTVHDVDVRHSLNLIVLLNKKFKTPEASLEEPKNKKDDHKGKVRSFPEMTYRSVADCAKMCSLDVECRSYSFCEDTRECLITSLDLRLSDVERQLAYMSPVMSDFTTHDKYELADGPKCIIFERDYLDAFQQTDEQVLIDRKLASQMPTSESPSACAKQAIDLETAVQDHHAALFVYCPTTSTCVLDEELFRSLDDATTDRDTNQADDTDNVKREERCIMYRKKYQNYFHVSPKVYVRSMLDQMDLSFETVEECARACWNQFGRVCASFDYCSPKTCLVNKYSIGETDANPELELRDNCLHYERDLKLDQLRKEHMIGRQKVLDSIQGEPMKQPLTFARILLNIVLMSLVSGSFVLGLMIGGRMNDRILALFDSPAPVQSGLGNVGSAGSLATGRRLSRALLNWHGFARRFGGSMQWSQSIIDTQGQPNSVPIGIHESGTSSGSVDMYGSDDAIQMDVIKGATNVAYEDKE